MVNVYQQKMVINVYVKMVQLVYFVNKWLCQKIIVGVHWIVDQVQRVFMKVAHQNVVYCKESFGNHVITFLVILDPTPVINRDLSNTPQM